MRIWIPIEAGPPTYTAQQRRWTTRGGKPVTYPDKRAKRTRAALTAMLAPYAPRTPMTGPVRMSVSLVYPYRRSEKKSVIKEAKRIPKVTRPDTDNLVKLLQDVMTQCGYWMDDNQVYDLHPVKYWGPEPGIEINIEEEN